MCFLVVQDQSARFSPFVSGSVFRRISSDIQAGE